MRYRLSWLETWSEKREADLPNVVVKHFENSEGWFDHEYSYHFRAGSERAAKQIAAEYSRQFEGGAVWSLYCEDPIMTEEDV